MTDVLSFLIAGCVFGLAGGFSPGPTSTVVVAQTLRFGILEGIKVGAASTNDWHRLDPDHGFRLRPKWCRDLDLS